MGFHAAAGVGLLLIIRSMPGSRFVALFCLLLAACSPALNWREVRLGGAAMSALLPCKPEHAVRAVELAAGRQSDLALWSCDADGATFAVSHMAAPDPARADASLQQWRAAVLARLRVAQPAAAAAEAAAAPFVPAGSLALPESLRMQVAGLRADGRSVVADAVWFARPEGGAVRLYHAVVYTPDARPQAADAFFAGLQGR